MKSLARRFQNNAQLSDQYNHVFQEYLAEGIVEEVNVDTENLVYYLLHPPVIKGNRAATKRRVFDASSHEKESPSLNEGLTGPHFNPDLFSIRIKFPQLRVAMMADISKAF